MNTHSGYATEGSAKKAAEDVVSGVIILKESFLQRSYNLRFFFRYVSSFSFYVSSPVAFRSQRTHISLSR